MESSFRTGMHYLWGGYFRTQIDVLYTGIPIDDSSCHRERGWVSHAVLHVAAGLADNSVLLCDVTVRTEDLLPAYLPTPKLRKSMPTHAGEDPVPANTCVMQAHVDIAGRVRCAASP